MYTNVHRCISVAFMHVGKMKPIYGLRSMCAAWHLGTVMYGLEDVQMCEYLQRSFVFFFVK